MMLRAYRPSDLETLWAIDQACFSQEICYTRDEIASFITYPGSRTWVAEENGAIVGFLIAGHQSRGVGHIVTIDVVEPSRRRGVGSKLMEAAEQWAREQGMAFIHLETAVDNLPAQRFYVARGYRRARRIENYYRNGLAAWLMVKGLKNQSKVER